MRRGGEETPKPPGDSRDRARQFCIECSPPRIKKKFLRGTSSVPANLRTGTVATIPCSGTGKGAKTSCIMRWALFVVPFCWCGYAGAVLLPLGPLPKTATPSYVPQRTSSRQQRRTRCLPPLTMSLEEEQSETSDSSAYLSGTKLTREQVGGRDRDGCMVLCVNL